MIRGKNHWWFCFEMTPYVLIKEKNPSKEVLSYMKTTKVQFNFIADVILSNTHYKNNPSLSVSWHFKKMIRKLKIEQRYPKNHLNLIE